MRADAGSCALRSPINTCAWSASMGSCWSAIATCTFAKSIWQERERGRWWWSAARPARPLRSPSGLPARSRRQKKNHRAKVSKCKGCPGNPCKPCRGTFHFRPPSTAIAIPTIHGRGAACESRCSAIHPEDRQCRLEGLRPSLPRCHARRGLAVAFACVLCVSVVIVFLSPASSAFLCVLHVRSFEYLERFAAQHADGSAETIVLPHFPPTSQTPRRKHVATRERFSPALPS
jgi:hypothetical protein